MGRDWQLANSLETLETKMKKLLLDFYEVDPSEVKFDFYYDLTAVFAEYNHLNAPEIALKAGTSPGLIRKFMAGYKYPPLKRGEMIEDIIKNMGKEFSPADSKIIS